MLNTLAFFISADFSIALMRYTEMSLRVGGLIIPKESYINMPPGFTFGSNLSREGWLSTIATS